MRRREFSKLDRDSLLPYQIAVFQRLRSTWVPVMALGIMPCRERAYEPCFLFSWPQSKCSVMGPDQLTGILDIIMREAAARSKKKISEEEATARKEMFKFLVEQESDVY